MNSFSYYSFGTSDGLKYIEVEARLLELDFCKSKLRSEFKIKRSFVEFENSTIETKIKTKVKNWNM